MSKQVETLRGYLGKAETAKGICNLHIKHLFEISKGAGMQERILRWLEPVRDQEYPYYAVYIKNFKIAKLIREYYKGITQERVAKQFIVKHGRELGDGFVGIGIKNQNYSNYYIVELYDGENGIQFQKTYDGYPSEEDLIMDSLFELDNRKMDKNETLTTVKGVVQEYNSTKVKEENKDINYYKQELNRGSTQSSILNLRGRYDFEVRHKPLDDRKQYLTKGIEKIIPGVQIERVITRPVGFYIKATDGVIKLTLPGTSLGYHYNLEVQENTKKSETRVAFTSYPNIKEGEKSICKIN